MPGESGSRARPITMRLFSRIHTALYRLSRGRLGQRTGDGTPVLLLTTRGRRSGRQRRTPLVYYRDGDRFVVCGGSGGTPRHPAWFLNLLADNRVGVQVGSRCFAARANELDGAERARVWRDMARCIPRVDAYQRHVARRVPLVVLEPDLPIADAVDCAASIL